jgi:hypothetical protein
MGNRCELPINVVRTDKSKDAERLEPKGKWYGIGVLSSPIADNDSTGEQVVPNPSSGT